MNKIKPLTKKATLQPVRWVPFEMGYPVADAVRHARFQSKKTVLGRYVCFLPWEERGGKDGKVLVQNESSFGNKSHVQHRITHRLVDQD